MPKARLRDFGREMSKASGAFQWRSSRLAAAKLIMTRAPGSRSVSATRTGRTTSRGATPIGDTQRIVSSTTWPHSEGVASTAASWSGCVSIAHSAVPMASRGSLKPPPMMTFTLARTSSTVSGWPAPSVARMAAMMEPDGGASMTASIARSISTIAEWANAQTSRSSA